MPSLGWNHSRIKSPRPTRRRQQDDWWKHAVIYEIYPRCFQDSNGDGIGDINGITSRLDYLHDLGIDAIWITPMYPSPGIDYGYDISDYTAIDPEYGTMADFDHMVAEAKQRGIRVIMDYVINHTSDQSPWFIESRSSRTNPKRDWYIWQDGKTPAAGLGQPPNNWQSWFGHSAWTYDEKTGQWYYHYFYKQQPDLNWRNPEVEKAMEDVLRFWMDNGVDGFRIDAVSRLFEDPNLHDDPYLPGYNAYGDRNIQHVYTDNFPEVNDVLKRLRKVVGKYPGDPVLITEADEPNIAELTKLYGSGDEVQLPMDFQIADENKLSAPDFRRPLQSGREQHRPRPARVLLQQSRPAPPVGPLRRRRPQRRDRQTHGRAPAHHPRNPADVLRRRNRHAHHRPRPHRRRPRPHRQARLAQGERAATASAPPCSGITLPNSGFTTST